jgi:DNA-directed RNA polymerase specialized sigma24 family protein
MTDQNQKYPVEAILDALDEEAVDETAAKALVQRLGIDVKKWTGTIRQEIEKADREDRVQRFDAAKRSFEAESARYSAKASEPKRSLEAQQIEMRSLLARVPRDAAAAVHFHKFEEASAEELAEMIKALRHLLGEDEE